MKKQLLLFVALLFATASLWAQTTNFETFSLGTVNYQGTGSTIVTGLGYTIPNPYGSLWTVVDEWGQVVPGVIFDQGVKDDGTGNKVWRISNAVTSTTYGAQPNSPSSSLPAGETTAALYNDKGPNHTTPISSPPLPRAIAATKYFHGGFKFKSGTGVAQAGLALYINAAPRQTAYRMSQIGIIDGGTGFNLTFTETTSGGGGFPSTTIATNLSYTAWHQLDIYVEFKDGLNVDGSGNDIITMMLDGTVIHTGTTWETYYASLALPSPRPIAVDALFLRAAGTAAPGTSGNGLYFDDVTVNNAQVPVVVPPAPSTTVGSSSSSACGTLDVPVTVKDFKNIGAVSLVLNYDPTKLQLLPIGTPPFQGVTLNPALATAAPSGNNTIGQFRLGDFPVPAINLNDDDVLFTLHFNVLPAAVGGSTTNLTWSTVTQECEYAGSGGTPVYTSSFINGAVTISARPVVNTTTLKEYCTIQEAINDNATLATHTITVDATLYTAKEQVLVNKEVTIKGINGQPTVDFLGTVTGKPTLFDISANNVTIDNIHFNVDLSKLRSAIIASAAGIDNITVKNNLIDAYGTAAGSYGDRNAVSINYSGSTNYRVATGGVNSITFTGNTVNGTLPASFFRAGVAVDEGGGAFTGNTLQTISHDILLRFGSNGAVNITGNNLNGGGIELADQNAGAGTFTVSSNIFTGGASDPKVALLRIKNNYNSIPHMVSLNTFNYVDWAVSLENMNSITLNGNTFSSAVATAHALVVNTKSITGNSSEIVQVPIGAIFTNNNFNGTGTALTFQNHDSDNDSYGTITIGTAGNENNFAATLGSFITLDGQMGSSDLSTTFPNYPEIIGTGGTKTTTMACWDQNLNAQNNKFALSSPTLPSAMTYAQLFALEDKIDHKIDNKSLGFVLVKASNAYVTNIAAPAANNNDYTRICNAVDYVANNWTINLHGTFDWRETNATASWALGNDGIVSTSDDYYITVKPDLSGVTFTAPEGLDYAAIIGPGDIPTANLEGILMFVNGTNNQSWTISNMRFMDFDMTILMDQGANTTTYNNTLITNNIIVVAKDLNKTVAPADVNQNIGIHFSFGSNQTISNNIIEIPGDGVSDGTNYSTSIGMQSNTSGGSVYDGLKIQNNIIRVIGLPHATEPAVIRGIWENGANSDAAIEISGNLFENTQPDNTADKNRQFAFWVTSVSSATKKVEYKNNEVSGFNEGIAWIGGLYTSNTPPAFNTGQMPVEIMNNKFDKMKNAVVVRKAVASTNTSSPALIKNNSFTNLVSGGLAIKNEGTGNAVSTCNWFGSVVASEIATKVSALVTYSPWLTSGVDGSTNPGFQPSVGCDEIPPEITCPANVTVNQHDAKDPYATGYATAPGATITFNDDRSGLILCNATGVIVRTWTATDLAGNTVTCNQTITVQDVDNPVVVVPANITVNTEPGLCSAIVNYPNPTATDFGFFQGFEDVAWVAGLAANSPSTDWNESYSKLTRQASGYNGVVSKTGGAHAVVTSDGLVVGGGIVSNESGIFSRLGGYYNSFGNGFVTSVDVYLDVNDPKVTGGTYGWDVTTAAYKQDLTHLRDFIFHAAGESGKIMIAASNNTNQARRGDLASLNHYDVTISDWYTLKWTFKNNGSGVLAVDCQLLDAAGAVLWTETKSNSSDLIASVVGGNGYMWFTFVDANKLAIDNTTLTRKLAVTPASLSGTAFAKGVNTITSNTVDACGKTGINSFTITVNDNQAPTITCPANVTVNMNSDCTATGVNLGTPVIADNCPDAIATNNAPASFNEGTTTVTWTVTDASNLTSTCTQTVTVVRNAISGTLVYNNTVKTPMNKVTLVLKKAGVQVGDPVITADGTGAFSFPNLCAGTYTIHVTNNIKVESGDADGINLTDAAQVNAWSANFGQIEHVKFLAGDVTFDKFIASSDALKIQRYFVYREGFVAPKWSYWKKGELITNNSTPYPSANPWPTDISVTVSGDVSGLELFGMLTGDFDGSLYPSTLKSASPSLTLTQNSNLLIGANQTFELPMLAATAMQVSAVSIILQIPSDLVTVQDVFIKGSSAPVAWAVNGNELRIGWYSLDPAKVAENGSLVTLQLKTTNKFTPGQSIDLALTHSPLNELADGNFRANMGANLLVAKVVNGQLRIDGQTDNQGLLLSNYPNPFNNMTTVTYTLPVDGKVTIDLYSLSGQYVASLVNATQSAGQYSIKLEGNTLLQGTYIAKLRLTGLGADMVCTAKLVVLK